MSNTQLCIMLISMLFFMCLLSVFLSRQACANGALLQGRQYPVNVYYTAAPEESYLDAALATVMQVPCLHHAVQLPPSAASCTRAPCSAPISSVQVCAWQALKFDPSVQVHAEEAPGGDILVFLTGQDEIESLARLISLRCALHIAEGPFPESVCMAVQT